MQDGNEAAKELERCMTQAQVQGRARSSPMLPAGSCQIRPSRRSGKRPRSSARWSSSIRTASPKADRLSRFYFNNVIGNPLETTRRPALPDLRRRAGAPSEPEDLRRARRRLSRRLFRPHRPRLGRALGRRHADLPKPPTSYLKKVYVRHGRVHAAPARRRWWRLFGARSRHAWAPIIRSTWLEYDPIGHIDSVDSFDERTALRLAAATRRSCWGSACGSGVEKSSTAVSAITGGIGAVPSGARPLVLRSGSPADRRRGDARVR